MKRHFFAAVCSLLLCVPAFAQEVAQNIPDFAGLRVRIFETATGNVLAPLPQSEFPKDLQIPDGATAHCFRHKDKICIMLVNSKKTPAGTAAFGLNSNFGELSIGILPYGEKRNLPETTVKDKSVEFKLAYGKTTIKWNVWEAEAEFAVPSPRKDVSLELVEYGAADKWKDVTAIAKEFLIAGSLNMQGSNKIFGGDPAPGVPKSMMVTYTIDDEDKMMEVRENGWVRIQYDPKSYFYRLTPKTDATFKFVISK